MPGLNIKSHPIRYMAYVGNRPDNMLELVTNHDRLLGAFHRLFGFAESLMTNMLCELASVSPIAGGFLMGKLGAGQKLGMLDDLLKNQTEDLKKELKYLSSRFHSLNIFRIKLAHQSIGLVNGEHMLFKQGAGLSTYLDAEEPLNSSILDSKIDDITHVIDQIVSIQQHMAGDTRSIADIRKSIEYKEA